MWEDASRSRCPEIQAEYRARGNAQGKAQGRARFRAGTLERNRAGHSLAGFTRVALMLALVAGVSVPVLRPALATEPAQQALSATADAQTLRLPLEIHTPETRHLFQVEVARTDKERARGLMERRDLTADQGMLFLFASAGDRYFWMKDTPLSLDIIFIGEDRRILRVAAGTEPFSERIIPSNGPARYVLEVLAGTAKRLGFGEGDLVVSDAFDLAPGE